MTIEIKIPTFRWKQVEGDMNPGAYGGTIAQADGQSIELLKIQPVREYVGDAEAVDVGFPFWTREAYFNASDLDPNDSDVAGALSYVGLDESALNDMPAEQRALTIACALLDYGRGDEGQGGWARDVLGDRRVKWYSGKRAQGWRYLASEDVEFRRLVREAQKEG